MDTRSSSTRSPRSSTSATPESATDSADLFCGVRIEPGEVREIYLKVSESFLSGAIQIPVTVVRGQQEGPTVFVTAAVHGDEINGTDIVRRLILELSPETLKGTVIAVPVVNIPGFLSQSRYLPYHRDLNRFFPGKKKGNNAERMAYRLFEEVVKRSDYGIDLHTASHGRVNLPHIRGDLTQPRVRELARAFGATVVLDGKGVAGSLRKSATDAGVPTILFEAGETGKFSRKVSQTGLKGVLNVLDALGMLLPGVHQRVKPPFQVIVKSSEWIRAEKGGILDLDVRPGDLVYEEQSLGEILNPFGRTRNQIQTPITGIVLGITSAPLTIPGTGVAHIARLRKTLALVERSLAKKGPGPRKRTVRKKTKRR